MTKLKPPTNRTKTETDEPSVPSEPSHVPESTSHGVTKKGDAQTPNWKRSNKIGLVLDAAVVQMAAESVKVFHSLEHIDESLKDRLSTKLAEMVERHGKKVASYLRRFFRWMLGTAVALILASGAVLWLGFENSSLSWLVRSTHIIGATVASALVFFWLPRVGGWYPPSSRSRPQLVWVASVSTAAAALAPTALSFNWHVLGMSSGVIAAYLVTPGIIGMTYWLFAVITSTLAERMDFLLARSDPEGAIALRLLDVLESTTPEAWTQSALRRKGVHALEGVARDVERVMLVEPLGDQLSDAIIRKAARATSRGFRAWKKRFVLGKESDRLEARAKFTRWFVAAMDGRWGDFARITEHRLPLSQLRRQAWIRTRMLIGGVLPLGSLLLISRVPGLERFEPGTYAIGTASAWLILSILLVVDPGLSERIRILKDAREVVSDSTK